MMKPLNIMNIRKYFSQYEVFYALYKKENLILKDGLKEFYKPVVWHLPILLSIFLLLFSYLLKTDLNTYVKNLISILPSLIGFLIASATILITVSSDKIDKIHNTPYTFREVGGAIFFYATKIAIMLLVIAFISTDNLESILNTYFYYIVSLIVILYFSKMIISILFGLMFLSDIIKTISKKEE